MLFHKIHHARAAEAIEKQVQSLILEGILRVGDRLPGERDLAKTMDVSRPIVREALASLVNRGLLEARHGGGTYVADVIGTVFAAPVVQLIGADAKSKADYLEYRREVEAIAASLAARRATEADRALLTRIVTDMEQAHEQANPEREAAIDVEFHSTISDCAHNIILLHTLRSCYRLLADDVFYNRGLIYRGTGIRDLLLGQHQAIYHAILAGKPELAATAATDHIIFVEKAMRDAERQGGWDTIAELRLAQRDTRENQGKRRSRKAVAKQAQE